MKTSGILLIAALTMVPVSLSFAQDDNEYADGISVKEVSPGAVRLAWKAVSIKQPQIWVPHPSAVSSRNGGRARKPAIRLQFSTILNRRSQHSA